LTLRLNRKLSWPIKLIWSVHPCLKKYSASQFTQITFISATVPSHRGLIRIPPASLRRPRHRANLLVLQKFFHTGYIGTFWQAADKAKALARGQDADAGRPATVREALADYETDLGVRGGSTENATRLNRLPPSLLSKPVSMLTVKELRHWRNG
jgi:hypothetical protein